MDEKEAEARPLMGTIFLVIFMMVLFESFVVGNDEFASEELWTRKVITLLVYQLSGKSAMNLIK